MSEENKIAFATTTEIRMPNGSRTIAFPAGTSGDNMRPWSFHEKIHDEADFQNEEVFQSTGPCLARFDGVEILESTPNVLGDRTTYFAKAFFGTNPGYKTYHLPSADSNGKATSAHISQNWLNNYRRTHTTRDYEREILAQYVSDISCVFPNAIINDCLATEGEIEWMAANVFVGAQYAAFDAESSIIAENYYKNGLSPILEGGSL